MIKQAGQKIQHEIRDSDRSGVIVVDEVTSPFHSSLIRTRDLVHYSVIELSLGTDIVVNRNPDENRTPGISVRSQQLEPIEVLDDAAHR